MNEDQILAAIERLDQRIQHAMTTLEERIERTEAKLVERTERTKTELEERIERTKTALEERIERTETKLLTAFHEWARTYEARARGTSTVVAAGERRMLEFDERLGYIEERLSRIERGGR